MSRVALRKKLEIDLCNIPYESLKDYLSPISNSDLINPLFSFICSNNILLKWRAVSCFGIVVPKIANNKMEDARIIMRRFLWSLNDESGGIGWGAPESMAEIMCNHDKIREEYLHMLISYMREDGEELFQDGNFLELPLLQQGLLWAIARMSTQYRELMLEKGVVLDVKNYLDSESPVVVALAVRCLKILGVELSSNTENILKELDVEFTVYEDGNLLKKSTSSFL